MSIELQDDWDRHWQEYSSSATLNPAQDFRRRLVFQHLRAPADASALRLLDIGSGNGDFAVEFTRRFPGAAYAGLEYSRSGVEVSQAKVPGATFLQRDLLDNQEPPERLRGWATHAVCSEVLEHVDDPGLLLRNAAAYMAKDARLVVTVPGGPMSAFDRHIGHRQHFSPDSLRTLLTGAGYAVEGVWGAGFPFFNLYRLVVIARGDRLIQDAREPVGLARYLSRAVMRVFGLLFHLNVNRSRLGWQMLAVARRVTDGSGQVSS